VAKLTYKINTLILIVSSLLTAGLSYLIFLGVSYLLNDNIGVMIGGICCMFMFLFFVWAGEKIFEKKLKINKDE
jgi:hypothetical protein